ncbi:cbb3-type cytochrome c oxidase subunit I [Acidithiobacillus montserratensis]|uniref:Cbb3-type cytochrome c oxidase subunit I n=1 Tax=Acidithiobacillus montserratensis TaxID=2729135 RepID=A0ACD5HCT9_9PROT|nr:cbb3-type cytochrome c oxidase subunit I [Acidithiobacillus montserratensis]MBN2679612.1 cbb3-type cytochrome c oxidase subunit I [Acidithiobacillaceae bacterium]MBU2747501.1 cytochrome o ubiquinol oxidase subunit I [Acidithiobacillus montserratensis]
MLVNLPGPWSPLLGRLALSEIPYTNPILAPLFVIIVLAGIALVVGITYYGKWGYLWKEWFTTVDHKKLGIMYIILGLIMLFRGFIDGLMMRTQQMLAVGSGHNGMPLMGAIHGYLAPFHFGQIYSAHGLIMILLAATPLLVGIMNIIVPLQIGARDMAYPYLNALGLWITAAAVFLIMISLFVGDFSHNGWFGYAPIFELAYSPGVGVDYWIWTLELVALGTTLGSINFLATVVKMRAPGVTWTRLPVFTWTAVSANIIALTSFPCLQVALALVGADRYLGTHFFTAGFGGNLMLYTNLFWLWGHPEVYFVILPAFGMISEVIPTFSEKPIFGYITMVLASFAIAGVSWIVWLHHFFTMGMGPYVSTEFSVATMLVGIPTGVKVFNWTFTMYRGRLTFSSAMIWSIGALFLLLIGGLTGMMLSIPAINYMVHNSVFVVAHFHMMLLCIVYAVFSAIIFWFPKVFGFKLNEAWGKIMFWLFSAGTFLVFFPMFMLGFMGETRRLDWPFNLQWAPWFDIQEVGIAVYVLSVLAFLWLIYVSIRDRAENRVGADAWGTSRSLEWITDSPVPFYNFAMVPHVNHRDEAAWRREHGFSDKRPEKFAAIHMPNNTPVAIVIGALTFVIGFGLTWRIWWLTVAALVLTVLVMIYRSGKGDPGYIITAEEMEKMDRESRQKMDDGHAPLPKGGGYTGGTVTAYSAEVGDPGSQSTPPGNSRPLS